MPPPSPSSLLIPASLKTAPPAFFPALVLTRTPLPPSSGLDFTCIALSQNIAKPTEELADSFRGAYANTLKPHHGMLIKPIFSAAMSACPYRAAFYEKLGSDPEKVQAELRPYLAALEKIVAILKGFQERKEAKW